MSDQGLSASPSSVLQISYAHAIVTYSGTTHMDIPLEVRAKLPLLLDVVTIRPGILRPPKIGRLVAYADKHVEWVDGTGMAPFVTEDQGGRLTLECVRSLEWSCSCTGPLYKECVDHQFGDEDSAQEENSN